MKTTSAVELVPHSKKRKRSQRLLSLAELIRIVPPVTTAYIGLRYIDTSLILGSENRSTDFGEDFLPVSDLLDERWLAVRKLLISGKLTEPIQALEYGGVYFVRDGNHRASVARHEGIVSLSAEVTSLGIPVALPRGMKRKDIPLFRASAAFEKRTGLFGYIPQSVFDVRKPSTWDRLEKHIEQGHRPWMKAKTGKDPDRKTLYLDWRDELYDTTVTEIEREGLSELFPGFGTTDIFVSLMDYWHTHPGWMNDIWSRYIRDTKQKKPLSRIWYALNRRLLSFRRSTASERERFLNMSRLVPFYPDLLIPEGREDWYRFLTDQLVGPHAKSYIAHNDSVPTMKELGSSWYNELFLPALELYRGLEINVPFPDFYRKWMKVWDREIRKGHSMGLKRSLAIMLKKYSPEQFKAEPK